MFVKAAGREPAGDGAEFCEVRGGLDTGPVGGDDDDAMDREGWMIGI
jgi:hypothetical protein